MKIKIGKMSILVLFLFFGGILATIATDLWTTTSTKVPAKYLEGVAQGVYNPEDIRGSYTFSEVSELFEVELEVLYAAFGIQQGTDGTQIKTKNLEELYSDLPVAVGNESVQVFVALYKELPITLTDTYLPLQAIAILKNSDIVWETEQLAYFESYGIDISKSAEDTQVPEELVKKEEEEEAHSVSGNTTFQEVLDTGIKREQIETILGNSMPPTNQTVKDYCVQNSLSFSSIKNQINALTQ